MKHLKILMCSFAIFSFSSTHLSGEVWGEWPFFGQELDRHVGPHFQSCPGTGGLSDSRAVFPPWCQCYLPPILSAGISSLMTLPLPNSPPGFLGAPPPQWNDSSFLCFLIPCCLDDNYSHFFPPEGFYHEQIWENNSLKEYRLYDPCSLICLFWR